MMSSQERESDVRPDQEGGGGFGGVASDRYSRVVQGALIYPIMHRRTLVRALMLPGAILIGLDYFLVGVTTEGESPGGWAVVSYSIAVVVMSTLVAVAVHRIILRRAVDPTVLPKWTRNETKFLFYSFALFLMCLPFLGLMFIPIIGPILGAVGLIVMLVRFSLVLPAAAIDEPLSFGEAWSKSRGHTFFMLFSVAMFPVALSLPIKALENFQYGVYIIPLVSIVTTILTVAALSVAYRIVVEEGGAATGEVLGRPRESES